MHRAFGNMTQEVIIDSLIHAKCSDRLVRAFMVELSECRADMKFADLTFRDMIYSKGGCQGGCDTPELWKRVLEMPFKETLEQTQIRGLGIKLPHPTDPRREWSTIWRAMVWADDILFGAESKEELKEMISILHSNLKIFGLQIKPGSIEIMGIWDEGDDMHEQWQFGEDSFVVHDKSNISILGV